MKNIIIVFLFILIFIFVLCCKYFTVTSKKKETLVLTENISSQTNLSPCPQVKIFSLSTGLIMDSEILCSFLKTIDGFIPNIHIENTETMSMSSDWILVNLDHTRFNIVDNSIRYRDGPKNLLCKTKQCYNILSNLNTYNEYNVVYSGFTSMDKYDSSFQRDYSKFVHIAGKSPYKNTVQLVNIWQRHPEWPTLTVLCREKHILSMIRKNGVSFENIDLIDTYVTNEKLMKLYNNHSIHICLSAHEGFGHYIYEGMSTEAVIVYGNVEPLNEWFNDMKNGIGVKMDSDGVVNQICPRYKINEQDFVKKIQKVMSMSTQRLKTIGVNARKTFLKQKQEFSSQISSIFKKNRIPKIIHSVWIDKKNPFKDVAFPQKYKSYKQTWINNHRNYTFLYWSGETVLKLITKTFPKYVDMYKTFPLMIKCDFARFVILYVVGGLYVDMDISSRSNVDHLLTNDTYFVKESKSHLETYQRNHDDTCEGLITNGFAGSVSNNPFVLKWIHQIIKNYKDFIDKNQVMDISGPSGLYKFYTKSSHDVFIGNTCSVSYINKDSLQIEGECKGRHNNPVLIHWWNGTEWGTKDDESPIIKPFISIEISNYNSIKTPLIWEENKPTPELEISKYIVDSLIEYPSSYSCICIGSHYGEISIPVSFMIQRLGSDHMVYSIDPDSNNCDFVEKMSLLNSLSNSVIIQKGISDTESYFQSNSGSTSSMTRNKWSKLSDIVLFSSLDSFHPLHIKRIRHIVITSPQENMFNIMKSAKKIIMLFQPILVLKYKCYDNECQELVEFLEEDISPSYMIHEQIGNYIVCSVRK